jgi:hypothetical protein
MGVGWGSDVSVVWTRRLWVVSWAGMGLKFGWSVVLCVSVHGLVEGNWLF